MTGLAAALRLTGERRRHESGAGACCSLAVKQVCESTSVSSLNFGLGQNQMEITKYSKISRL